MELEPFDALTRRVVSVGRSRRRTLQVLVGIAFGGLAGRIDPAEGTVAKQKRRKRKKQRKKVRKPQTCAAGEMHCDDGSCASQDECCPTAKRCADGSCIAPNQCCREATTPLCGDCHDVVCDSGNLQCRSTCHGEGSVCCNGACVGPCGGGKDINPATCECECPRGSELMADGETCCPSHRVCGLNEAGLVTTCCDEWNICIALNYCS